MSTPEAPLGGGAGRARDAAARMILHAQASAPAAEAVRAARSLELAVHAEIVGHVRRAREAGESWAAVGEMLGFRPDRSRRARHARRAWIRLRRRAANHRPVVPGTVDVRVGLPGLRPADRRPRSRQGARLRSGRTQGRLCPPGRRSRRLGTGGPAMNGPQDFRQAEKLLAVAAAIGLSARLDRTDERAWRGVAASQT